MSINFDPTLIDSLFLRVLAQIFGSCLFAGGLYKSVGQKIERGDPSFSF